MRATSHEGFVTVDSDRVILLAETVELASKSMFGRPRTSWPRPREQGTETEVRKAEGRLQVAVGPRH